MTEKLPFGTLREILPSVVRTAATCFAWESYYCPASSCRPIVGYLLPYYGHATDDPAE